ncbi:MAG: dockerin type I repeat-containing protein [Clostridia bacterium]|nr:dockerin type I repeat-containing protein [Clostridia bacterium]
MTIRIRKTASVLLAAVLLLLAAFPASAGVVTNTARQNVIDYMTAMATVSWTAGATFSPEAGPTYQRGCVYYGIPYSQNLIQNITLPVFQSILASGNGTVSYDIGRNDCSSAVCDALSHSGYYVAISNTRLMVPDDNNLVAVGSYTFAVDKATTCARTGRAQMFANYALLQPGDCLVTNGHAMLVSEVDPANNCLRVIEQTGGCYVYDPLSGQTLRKVTEDDDWNTTWNINGLKTFDELFTKNYIPLACSGLYGVPYRSFVPVAPSAGSIAAPVYNEAEGSITFTGAVNNPDLCGVVSRACTMTNEQTGEVLRQTNSDIVIATAPEHTVSFTMNGVPKGGKYDCVFRVMFIDGTAIEYCGKYAVGDGRLGDVSGDGIVTPEDARLALRHSVELEEFDEEQLFLGDIDSSGAVDSSDARMILRAAVALEQFW